MLRSLVATVFVLTGAILTPSTASAIVVTLDDYSLTAVRPLTGTTQADFTGTITVTDGFELELAPSLHFGRRRGTSSTVCFPT